MARRPMPNKVKELEEPQKKIVKVISDKKLRLRAGRSVESEVLMLLDPGTELVVINEKDKEWIKVQLGDKIGFVMSEFVK